MTREQMIDTAVRIHCDKQQGVWGTSFKKEIRFLSSGTITNSETLSIRAEFERLALREIQTQ